MSLPNHLDKGQIAAIGERVSHCLALANKEFQHAFPRPQLRFDLRGAAAGQFRGSDTEVVLRFNSQLFALHFAGNLEHTVPHEVAHYVVFALFVRGKRRGRVRPHGMEWKAVMALFGVPAEVRHQYDVSQIPVRRERRVRYQCGCREHLITLRTHRKMAHGQQRACTRCNQKLRLKK
ncbi:MAG: SprT-like domain-containing protein [Pseudomonadota bacterium]